MRDKAVGRSGRRAVPGPRNPFDRLLRAVRRIAGMPDYQAYLEHLRVCHPDRPVPTEREYFAEYTEARYGAGVSRCC